MTRLSPSSDPEAVPSVKAVLSVQTTLSIQDPLQLSLEQRLEIARFHAACYAFAFPEDPPLVVAAEAEELARPSEDEEHRLVLARSDSGLLIGTASLNYALSQNTDKTYMGVTVHPEFRRRGVGRQLAVRAAELALELGRTTFTSGTSTRSPQGEPFAASLGAKAALPMIISDLVLSGLAQAQLRQWVTRPDADAYALHRFRHIPEGELERVAAIMQVMNTAPRGELEFDDWTITPAMVRNWQENIEAIGEARLLYAVEHLPSRELVGYTEVYWHPERASLVYQGATAVRPDHREHGLGKWLKAAVLLDLPEAFPGAERVRTGNADVNAAMLGINRALGFEPAFGRTEWQGQTQELLTRAAEARRNPLSI
jgi:mycothiol synthase